VVCTVILPLCRLVDTSTMFLDDDDEKDVDEEDDGGEDGTWRYLVDNQIRAFDTGRDHCN
jgi:hypothetical protein